MSNSEETEPQNSEEVDENLVTVEVDQSEASDTPTEEIIMAESFRIPPVLTFDGNVKEKWCRWSQKFDLYLKASGLSEKSEDRQIAVLLNIIGDEALEKYNTSTLTEAQKKSVKETLKAFEDYCTPKANEAIERHIFNSRFQREGEDFMSFLTALKTLSSSCNFGTLCDSLVRDRIICGIRDLEVKTKLLKEDDLTLEKCISICKASELAELQMKTLESEEEKIHGIKKYTNKYEKKKQDNSKNQNVNTAIGSRTAAQQSCSRCGRVHQPRQCPAFNKDCNKCGKKNHFASMCRVTEPFIRTLVSNEDDNDFFIGALNSGKENRKSEIKNSGSKWLEEILVNNKHRVKVKFDTGANTNAISSTELAGLNIDKKYVNKCSANVKAYGDTAPLLLAHVPYCVRFRIEKRRC